MIDNKSTIESKYHYLSIVSDFARQLLSLNDVHEVLWYVTKNVISKLEFEDVVIYLYDENKQCLVQSATYGNKNPAGYVILNPLEIRLGQGIVGKAAQNQRTIVISDTRCCEDYIVDDLSRLSELAIPMIADGKLIGVIDSEHSKVGFYTQPIIETLQAIASMVATKVSKISAIYQLREVINKLEYASKLQDCLFEIAELIFETDDIQEFYRKLHLCIGRLTNTTNFYIAIESEDKKYLTLPYCVDEQETIIENEIIPIEPHFPSITGYTLLKNKALLMVENDIIDHIARKNFYVIGAIPKTWLGVPFGNDKLRGIVVVQSYNSKYSFTEKDKQLLSFVAKHIYNAMERMQTRSKLEFMALHDPLTQLPNRLLFADRVEHAIENSTRHPNHNIAILFLDLDRFKLINDTYGHHIGDQVLVHASQMIKQQLRSSDTLSRLGGDEFAILLENLTDNTQLTTIANNIIEAIQTPITVDNLTFNVSTSIGISISFNNEQTSDDLLVQADQAMYHAKQSGRNQICFYHQLAQSSDLNRYTIESDFTNALNNNELVYFYQPIHDLDTGSMSHAEALIRWQHPEHGLLSPNAFLPEIERVGLLHQLDLYTLQKACDLIENNLEILPSSFRLSINISGAGFNSLKIKEIIDNIPGDVLKHLCIEITEQTIVDNITQTKESITYFNQQGIDVALDDFGTGYSSLNYINQFTFQLLKIDRAFINQIENVADNSIILETIIKLSQSLKIKTVAEGIETKAQLDCLTKMQCNFGQGYFIAMPITEEKLINSLLVNSRESD